MIGTMRFDPQASMLRLLRRSDRRRRSGRLPQESLTCNLGAVLDLSAGGMRLLCNRPLDGKLRVFLAGYDLSVALQAEVVWTHRHGRRRHEVGLKLLDVDHDLTAILSRISTMHRQRRAV